MQRLLLLQSMGSIAHRLQEPCLLGSRHRSIVVVRGLVAPWHAESSKTKDRTCVPYIGRWILKHRTAREVLFCHFST